jgi:hypothetical protein
MSASRLRRLLSPVLWFVVAGCVVSVSAALAGPGPGGKLDHFVGLWVGVDSLDGSPVRLSLSDVDDDGVLEHTMQEDFFTVCFDRGPTFSRGRGVVRGTATVASKGVLDATTELFCIDDDNVAVSHGPATQVQYTLGSRNAVLVLPAFGNSPAIVLHRTGP